MASIIQLKTGTGSAVPTSLTQGEVAINIDSGLVFYGSGSGNDVKNLANFVHITASGNISSSGNISTTGHITASGNARVVGSVTADSFVGDGSGLTNISTQAFTNITASGNVLSSGSIVHGNVSASGDLLLGGDITASGNIIGTRSYFGQTIITLSSTDISNEVSPFVVKIADSNGEDEKLEVNYEGVLKFGALNTLPTAITGGLVYSPSNFYMGLS